MEKNYTQKSFGSLYLNGKAVRSCLDYKPGTLIHIGDTNYWAEALTWIKPKGMNIWISENIFFGVTFRTLESQGFIEGIPVEIDGAPYLCRLIQDYPTHPKKNEWDRIVAALGDNIGILGIGQFWVASQDRLYYGQTLTPADPKKRSHHTSHSEFGFRLVLQRQRKKNEDKPFFLPGQNVIKVILPWSLRPQPDAYFVELGDPVTNELRDALNARLNETVTDYMNSDASSKYILEMALKRFKVTTGVTAKIMDIPYAATIIG